MDLVSLWQQSCRHFDDLASKTSPPEEWLTLAKDLDLVRRMVDSLALFSPNESLEDCPTGTLQFMALPYYLGAVAGKQKTGTTEERQAILQSSQEYFESFLAVARSYGLAIPVMSSDRDTKIVRLRRSKELETRILEQQPYVERLTDQEREAKEEQVRQLELDKIELALLRTVNELSLVQVELSLLKQGSDSPDATVKKPLPKGIRRVQEPFTLLKTRDTVRDGVFRPGHRLPTMTIDEYLAIERQRGGIIESTGGANAAEPESEDEDRVAEDEGRLMAARRMDAYKDEHRRGSGNTYNRG